MSASASSSQHAPNALAQEASPYLQQHAHNPVQWQPWNEATLQRARAEDKPILLSIGYSACHWCHVMERESFSDERIAALMNENFINIKVDREERPDLDKIYQEAHYVMTRRSGGWPLTMFLTPELKPFYGGTYFPPADRYGMPGFSSILQSVATVYYERRDQAESIGGQVQGVLADRTTPQPGGLDSIRDNFLQLAYERMSLRFDQRFGGFGRAPKFPNTTNLELLMHIHARVGSEGALAHVERTLDAMAAGGIYDQLGGGFHRYSTDAQWLVPHFEKMLYDNGPFIALYTDAWRITGHERYARVVRECVAYVLREMTAPEGFFYATQDADSDGREGAFFAWTPQQLEQVLGAQDAALAAEMFGVTQEGNFEEGLSVLHRPVARTELEKKYGAQEFALAESRIIQKLFAAREERNKPFRDEKIIAAWNGLMIHALAQAGAAFGEKTWTDAAERALLAVRQHLWNAEHKQLQRTRMQGRSYGTAFLQDYALLAEAALSVYEATGSAEALSFANELCARALKLFWNPEQKAFMFAAASAELISAPQEIMDQELPAASATMLHVLLRIAALENNQVYSQIAEQALNAYVHAALETPFAFATALRALDSLRAGPSEIVLVGPLDDARTQALFAEAQRAYVPNRVIRFVSASEVDATKTYPLHEGAPTVYVCRNRTCSAPVQKPEQLRTLLNAAG